MIPEELCDDCIHYIPSSYDDNVGFCGLHPEYGELVEKDTCDDWKEVE